MKHWHYMKGSLKSVFHSHEGGHIKHEHSNLIGYGRTKSSLRVEYGRLSSRQKQKIRDAGGTQKLASDVIGYAMVSRLIGIIPR